MDMTLTDDVVRTSCDRLKCYDHGTWVCDFSEKFIEDAYIIKPFYYSDGTENGEKTQLGIMYINGDGGANLLFSDKDRFRNLAETAVEPPMSNEEVFALLDDGKSYRTVSKTETESYWFLWVNRLGEDGATVSNDGILVKKSGGNDCDFDRKAVAEAPNAPHMPKTDIKTFAEGYTRILNRIKELGKQPVILSLPPIDSERFFDRVSEGLSKENILKFLDGNKRHISDWHEHYNLETFKIAAANNVPIIDITSKFLECSNYSDYLYDDGIHPNEKGHRLIADTIRKYIKEKRVDL